MEVKADVDLLPNAGCRCVQRSPVVVQRSKSQVLAMHGHAKWKNCIQSGRENAIGFGDHMVESFICGAIVADAVFEMDFAF